MDRVWWLMAVAAGGAVVAASGAEPRAADPWRVQAAPVFEKHCTKCHGGVRRKGGLDLRNAERVLRGGEEGAVVQPGSPEESRLFEVIQPGSDARMPPKGEPLGAREIAQIGEWIAGLPAGGVEEGTGRSESPLPPGLRPDLVIDFALEQEWMREEIDPAPRCGDAEFVRRVYLDVAGRLPSWEEREAFLSRTEPDKRARLVDTLLEGADHARHFAELFSVLLLGREAGRPKDGGAREANGWLAYLEGAFAANRSWDRVAADLVTGRSDTAEARGAAWFLYEKGNDHQEMAKAAAPLLFGVQIQCAQCHDHPLVPEIEQRHYWGLTGFFRRSFNVRTPAGPGVAESAAGGYEQYSDLGGGSHPVELVLISGARVEEEQVAEEDDSAERYRVPPPPEFFGPEGRGRAAAEGGGKERRKSDPEWAAIPAPRESRREALVRLGVEENPRFAEAMVNRVWALLMGRGLVHPVDQMDSLHPASHPELLRWLGREFAARGHDVRWLIRAITGSAAYQMDSRWEGETAPAPELFARGLEKPLTAEVYLRSMLVAGGHEPDGQGGFRGVEWAPLRDRFAAVFPEVQAEVFSPSVQQALFLTNGPELTPLLGSGSGGLIDLLARAESPEARVEAAFLRILGRAPDSEEREAAAAYLRARQDRSEEGLRQLAWALLAGPEFRFNH